MVRWLGERQRRPVRGRIAPRCGKVLPPVPPRPPRGFGGETGPEREALQQAFDSKAVADDLKAKLAKLREARKAKEAKLEKAQDELRQVLTVRQEAAAVLAGLLK